MHQFLELRLECRRIPDIFAAIDRKEKLIGTDRLAHDVGTRGECNKSFECFRVIDTRLHVLIAIIGVEKPHEQLVFVDVHFGRSRFLQNRLELGCKNPWITQVLGSVQREEELDSSDVLETQS